MMFPLVRDLAGDGIPVTVTCRVLKLCRPQYYRWLDEPVTDAQLDEAYLANAIFDAHRDDPEFGYRFLADEVRAAGFEVSDRVVWRICRDMGWWSVFGKPKARKSSKPGTPAHDDLVRRQFRADTPNTVWVADLTEHRNTRCSTPHRPPWPPDPTSHLRPRQSRTCGTACGRSTGSSSGCVPIHLRTWRSTSGCTTSDATSSSVASTCAPRT